MNKYKTLAAVALLLTGCSTTYITHERPDGGKTKAYNSRFIWSTEGFALSHATNFTSIKLERSNPDAQTAGAIAEGVARGVKP